jgi:hypothetical protein
VLLYFAGTVHNRAPRAPSCSAVYSCIVSFISVWQMAKSASKLCRIEHARTRVRPHYRHISMVHLNGALDESSIANGQIVVAVAG